MTLAQKPTYTSGKLEPQEELQARIQAGLKPPWSFSKYTEWKDEIRLCLLQEQEQLWQQSQPSVGRKTFLWGPFRAWPKWPFRRYRRPHLALLSQFLLAHWPVMSHLHRIGKATSPLCRFCSMHNEDQEHLFSCLHFQDARLRLWGAPKSQRVNTLIHNRNFINSLIRFLGVIYKKWGMSQIHL